MKQTLDVLLATYCNQPHLPALLDSLWRQTDQDFRVLARDDASSDATAAILAEAERSKPGRLVMVHDELGNVGALRNFARLLEVSDAPYAMFCDADDIWLPDKIERTRDAMRQMEREVGASTPVLVHTDLEVVDDELRTRAPSLWRYQHLESGSADRLERVAVQNVVTGCTAMLNRALVERMLPTPGAAIMHDWWAALTAAAFGRIGRVDAPTVRYRQHAGNAIGAKGWTLSWLRRRAMDPTVRDSLVKTQRQAAAFLDRHRGELRPEHAAALEAYAGLGQAGWIERRRRLVRHGLWKIGWIRNVGLLIRI